MPHLDRDVKGQAVDVVDVAQTEQAGEQPATQHAHRQVQPDGQALPDDATARAAALALACFTSTAAIGEVLQGMVVTIRLMTSW